MVEHPAACRWSSYRAKAQGEALPGLAPPPLYLALGATPAATSRELFRIAREADWVDELRCATNGHYALGNARFHAETAAALGRRTQRGVAGRPARRDEVTSGALF